MVSYIGEVERDFVVTSGRLICSDSKSNDTYMYIGVTQMRIFVDSMAIRDDAYVPYFLSSNQ